MTNPAAPAEDRTGSRLARLALSIGALRGWRRHGLAILLGIFVTAAFAPIYAVPLLVPAFTGMVWLLNGVERPRTALAVGWSFGFGHMATGLSWVGLAFLVDAERFGALMPVAIGAMAAGMAIFPAVTILLLHLTKLRGPSQIVALAGAWLLIEWVRTWLFTGFPWNLAGYVWSFAPEPMQLAAYGGVWSLSLLTVLAAAAPAALWPRAHRGSYAFCAVVYGLLALVWIGGALRLAAAPAPGTATVDGVRLRLVQASIAQTLKWDPALRREHIHQQMRLTLGPGFEKITHVIWPETAVPYLLDGDVELRQFLGRVVPRGGALITGAPRGNSGRIWNSILAIDARGDILTIYDKHHLVPFGEYVPFRSILPVEKLTAGNIDFTAGPGLVSFAVPGLPAASALICYEVIFPGHVVPNTLSRPAWLLNVTNDAWFGTSLGPFQHFASARMRAVEEGLPLVRAANTGITAIVDGYGRILGQLGLNDVGVIDTDLPKPVTGISLYAEFGNWSVAFLIFCAVLCSFILRRFSQ